MSSALVLLHFFGGSRRSWSAVVPSLGSDRTVLALDMPGFGDAAALGAMDVRGMADQVDRSIGEAGLDDCVVVGHSMSGKVAAVLAARRPAYLRGLVLVAPSPPSPEPMSDEARARLLAFDGSHDAAARYIDGATAARLPDALRDIAIDDAMRASRDAWMAWALHGSREDRSDDVGMLALPTLVVAGRSDEALGEAAQRRSTMPHLASASLVVLDGGHALPFDNPAGLAGELERFVERLT